MAAPMATPGGCLGSLGTAAATAAAAGGLARELGAMGVTPQQATSGARQGAQLAHELGMTPQEARRAGVHGARAVGQASEALGVTPREALSVGARLLGGAQGAAAARR